MKAARALIQARLCPAGGCNGCHRPLRSEEWLYCAKCAPQYGERLAKFGHRATLLTAEMAVKQLPTWHQSRSYRTLRECVARQLLPIADRFRFNQSLAILGYASGSGKTTAVATAVQRIAEAARSAEVDANDEVDCLDRLCWAPAHAVVRARQQHPFGEGDAPIVLHAKRAGVLILDELGAEPASEVLFEIVDARYAAGLPTVITSGLRPEEFRSRYGDACWRRLTEDGVGAEVAPKEGT